MNVQVILSEDVPNLGRTGDVVKVRAGFARNYLLPRHLAVEANQRNIRAFEHNKRVSMLKRERRKIQLPEPLKRLGEFQVAIRLEAEVEASLKVEVAAE